MAVKSDQLPNQIRFMCNAVYKYDKDKCASYVYFLMREDRVVYVGQTSSLKSRINAHKKDKDFGDVYYIPVDKDNLNEAESAFIRFFIPEYNKTWPSTSVSYRKLVSRIALNDPDVRVPYWHDEKPFHDQQLPITVGGLIEELKNFPNDAVIIWPLRSSGGYARDEGDLITGIKGVSILKGNSLGPRTGSDFDWRLSFISGEIPEYVSTDKISEIKGVVFE